MTTKPAVQLAKGAHYFDGADDGPRCLFEAYNWAKREVFTDDRPPGVSPALHIFGMRLNDCLPDDTRQRLVRYLPNGDDPLDGTEDDGREETRGYIALDWLIRTYLLRFLELSPRLAAHAASVRKLPRIDSMETAEAAGVIVRAARDAAGDAAQDAAWAAAWDVAGYAAGYYAAGYAAGDAVGETARAAAGHAAWAAAWDAAGDAARDAARAAAGHAAQDAARAAAWDAARDAARAAAWAAARDAAGYAARDAAGYAARAAAGYAARAAAGYAARAAARDAARAALNPTVVILQESALALYDQMIEGTW